MSRLHEIKAQMDGVAGTKKITRAMYLISASKSKKAKAQLEGTFPYFRQIESTLTEILAATGPLETPYLGYDAPGGGKKNLYLVLGGDKGMAGGYNANVIKELARTADPEKDDVLVAGFLARNLLARKGFRVDRQFQYPVMNPSVYRAREIAEIISEKYESGEYGKVYLVYTNMISPIRQEAATVCLLPLKPEALSGEPALNYDAVLYEPSPKAVFEYLIPHYLKGIIYSAFVESFTSEQHARMVAMDGATKSADEIIDKISIRYNRARQYEITQEINEIVGGIPAG